MEGSFPNERSSPTPSTEAELVSQVETALYQLYNDPDPSNKTAADRWLQVLQHSQQAWSLPWVLLQHQSFEVKNFGALMLHNKIHRGWTELPPDHCNVIRVELFKHLASFSSGHRLVLIQLCRALVGVVFHTMPDQWPNAVVSCIHSLKKACQDLPGSNFVAAVIQLLTILPEEFDKMSSNTLTLRRGVIKNELTAGLPSVLSLVEEVLSTCQDNSIKISAIKCCGSWILLGCPLPEMSSLTDVLFCCLRESELLESASDTLSEMVSHDDSFKYPTSLLKFMQRVLEARDFIRMKLEENNEEVCMSLVKLVQETAVSNMEFLLTISDGTPPEDCDSALAMVQLVVEFFCVSGTYPMDERCSEVTFQFWENFLDRIASSESEQSRYLLEFYSSPISSLIEVFPDKAQYPSDEDWKDYFTDDDRDDFIKYREDLCDLGESLQFTMHVEYLQNLSSVLTNLLSGPHPPTWQSVEAVLCLLQGVASNVTQQSSPLLQNILALFSRMPPHPTLIKTSLSLLGLLSSWFKHQPSLLQGILPIILGGLSQPELASSAALAFRDICSECATQLSSVATQLIPHCQQALSNPQLSSADCMRVIAAIGSVLSVLPLSNMVAPLESLVSSQVERIQSLAQEDPSETNRPLVEKELDILGSLCHHIYPTLREGERHPLVLLLVQLFPSIQAFINKWCRDSSVVEAVCVVINRAMRTVDKQFSPLLEQTVELIVKCYAVLHHPKLLVSASHVIEVFGDDTSYSSILSALLQPLYSLTLQFFQSAMCEHPDLVQSYLELNTTILKTCPAILTTIDGLIANLFDIGLTALKLPEHPTVDAASTFLVTFIGLSSSMGAIGDMVQVNGKLLLQYVLQAIAWAAPRSYLVSFSEILYSLHVHCLSLLSQWLEELLAQDGFPSNHLTTEEKQQFKSTVLRGQSNKRVLKEKLSEFALKCRGFHGTVYALETS